MRRKNAETQGTKERFNHRKWLVSRQSWCRAIQTYEDTLSFGVISKLSHQNCQTMLFGFPRLSFYIFKWHRRSRPSRASAFLRQSLSRTSTRDWQDLKISRFRKESNLDWAKLSKTEQKRIVWEATVWEYMAWGENVILLNELMRLPWCHFYSPLIAALWPQIQSSVPSTSRSIRMTRRP